MDDVHDVEYNAIFKSHDNIEIAKSDVHVHYSHLLAPHRQGRSNGSCRGGLANTAFAR
jgi:hypothetical protein